MTLSRPITLRLEPEQQARLSNLADRTGLSVSELVRQMSSAGIGKLESEGSSDCMKVASK